MTDIRDIDESIAKKIMNLLAVAKDTRGNENEAANAMRAAQRLADAHNLSLANLDPSERRGTDKKRTDTKFEGGLYVWQRALYAAIAELNHCKHWVHEEVEVGKVSAYEKRKYGAEEAKFRAEQGYSNWGKTFKHRLLGSPINVMLCNQMAEYLQGTIERLAREYVDNDAKRFFVQDAIAFREGCSDRIVQTLRDKRAEDLAEQRRKQQEARDRGDGSSLMILDDIATAEEEANYDHLNGEGAWARRKAEEAAAKARWQERMDAAKEAQRIQDEWDAANPALAAARKKAEAEANAAYWADIAKREAKKASLPAPAPRMRLLTDREVRQKSGSYYDGSRAGAKVGLDKQVDSTKKGFLK